MTEPREHTDQLGIGATDMTDRTHPDSGRIITSGDILLHDAKTALMYEELRAAIDDGNESMTHADALAEIAAIRAENERLAALVEAQQRATHVQQSAEIEHVAGGVSKNGPESNMAQQPAPSAAAATKQEGEHLFELWWSEYMPEATQERAWKAWTEAPRTDGVGVASPTPQADSQPAPVNAWQQAIDHELVTAHLGVAGPATFEEARKTLHDLICWHIDVATDPATNGGKVLVDAARAPADCVTAPAGGAVAGPGFVQCSYGDGGYACCEGGPCQADLHNEQIAAAPTPAAQLVGPDGRLSDELRSMIEGMSVSVDVSTGDHDAGHRYFGTVTEVMDDTSDKHGVTLLVQDAEPNFAPTPPAQAADSVLEDAARLEFEMQHGPAIERVSKQGGA